MSRLHLLLLYEDFHTAMRVKKAIDCASTSVLPEGTVDLRMWKIDQLGISQLRALATADLFVSDLILISLHDDQQLPPPVQRWLTEWPERPTSGPAVLAVWADADQTRPQEDRSGQTSLQKTAERCSLELIPNLACLDTHGSSSSLLPGPEAELGGTAAMQRAFCCWLAEVAQEAGQSEEPLD